MHVHSRDFYMNSTYFHLFSFLFAPRNSITVHVSSMHMHARTPIVLADVLELLVLLNSVWNASNKIIRRFDRSRALAECVCESWMLLHTMMLLLAFAVCDHTSGMYLLETLYTARKRREENRRRKRVSERFVRWKFIRIHIYIYGKRNNNEKKKQIIKEQQKMHQKYFVLCISIWNSRTNNFQCFA